MSDNSQNQGLYSADKMEIENNMNKYFALILTGVILRVLLWNPITSNNVVIRQTPLDGISPGQYNAIYNCTKNVNVFANIDISTDMISKVIFKVGGSTDSI